MRQISTAKSEPKTTFILMMLAMRHDLMDTTVTLIPILEKSAISHAPSELEPLGRNEMNEITPLGIPYLVILSDRKSLVSKGII
jgi:hypothetical protein